MAIAGPASRRLAASWRAAPAESRPATAIVRPLPLRSAARPESSSRPRDGLITARELSSTSSKMPGVLSAPESVISWPCRPSRARCAPMDAAALTANSNDDVAPLPICAERRVSSRSSTRFRHCCSSRRTMSSPYRAVERQCTRRSSSPSRYARGTTSSSPAAAAVRARPSPSPRQLPLTTARGSGTTFGVTTNVVRAENERPSSTRPKASAIRISSGPTSNLPLRSERSG